MKMLIQQTLINVRRTVVGPPLLEHQSTLSIAQLIGNHIMAHLRPSANRIKFGLIGCQFLGLATSVWVWVCVGVCVCTDIITSALYARISRIQYTIWPYATRLGVRTAGEFPWRGRGGPRRLGGLGIVEGLSSCRQLQPLPPRQAVMLVRVVLLTAVLWAQETLHVCVHLWTCLYATSQTDYLQQIEVVVHFWQTQTQFVNRSPLDDNSYLPTISQSYREYPSKLSLFPVPRLRGLISSIKHFCLISKYCTCKHSNYRCKRN